MNTTKGFRMRRMNENFNKENWCAPSVSELARDLEEAVKYLWDNRDEGGCYHWPIYYEENGQEWDVALGWAEGYEEDPNIYYEDGYAICASVRYQTAHNAMQTDLNIDFLMPCYENGDCCDADVTVGREEDFNDLAETLLVEGKKMVEEFADKDVEEDEDMDESRRFRGRMLREGRRPMRRRMNEATAVVNPRIASKFMGKIEDLSRELAKYIGGDEWNSNVISRAVKSLNAAIDHLEDVE